MKPDRLLFLDTYTDPTFKSISSPEIGYGISCAKAIKSGMRELNISVVECSPIVSKKQTKLNWIYECYENLNKLSPKSSDIVFVFHSLIHFPGEIRRLVNHHTRVGCPVIGYTHGSHWDPTDLIRCASNPGLLFQDLANLLSYDRLLLVSEYYRKLLRKELTTLGPLVTERFDSISRVVGLPIDTDTIDTFSSQMQSTSENKNVRIVFNHALRPPKRPDIALSVIERILNISDKCTIEITRSFDKGTPLELDFKKLLARYKNRIVCHDTLPLNNYYRLLWECDIQFSTASHESFGVSTIEAMYTYNACFTPDNLSYPEITGSIGNYHDIDQLVGLIEKSIYNTEFRREIIRSQREIAMNYRTEIIVNNINKVIAELDFCPP